MTRAQRTTLGLLSIIACVVWLAVFYFVSQGYRRWSQQPLGPTLAYPTQFQLPAISAASTGVILPTLTAPPNVAFETPTPVPSFLSCNNNAPIMTVLAIGTDVRPGQDRSGLTDFMRAVRVDFQGQRVTTLEFPRDLWVQIPGFEYNQKLNTAYAYGRPENGPGLLASTLYQNFGLNVDHYMVANMTLFADVVDSLGGLDITIPPGGIDGRTTTDRSERLIFLEGLQHLSGEQALTLARLRNVSVFERAKNQNLVMCALRKKVESPEVVLKLPAIINSFMNNIQTDLTPDQISQLACLGTQMPRENILFAAFPRELFHSAEAYDSTLNQNVFIWDVDFSQLRSYVSDFQAGTWPSASPSGVSEPETGTCE